MTIHRPGILTALLMPGLMLGTTAASAQSTRGNVVTPPGGQIDAAAPLSAPSIATGQVNGVPVPAAVATSQITARRASRDAQAQLNFEHRGGPPATQLYRGGRTAQPAEALSRPSEGRRQSVIRVGGRDRCDPGAPGAAPRICDRVIETRAAEFVTPPATPLSPEQRLLVDKRLREGPSSAEGAVARIGRNDIDPRASDAQAVASLVLAPTQSTATLVSPGDLTTVGPGVAEAIVQAIVTGAPSPR